eukprot:6213938-Pleurochrysis_carterae.AAC.7
MYSQGESSLATPSLMSSQLASRLCASSRAHSVATRIFSGCARGDARVRTHCAHLYGRNGSMRRTSGGGSEATSTLGGTPCALSALSRLRSSGKDEPEAVAAQTPVSCNKREVDVKRGYQGTGHRGQGDTPIEGREIRPSRAGGNAHRGQGDMPVEGREKRPSRAGRYAHRVERDTPIEGRQISPLRAGGFVHEGQGDTPIEGREIRPSRGGRYAHRGEGDTPIEGRKIRPSRAGRYAHRGQGETPNEGRENRPVRAGRIVQ